MPNRPTGAGSRCQGALPRSSVASPAGSVPHQETPVNHHTVIRTAHPGRPSFPVTRENGGGDGDPGRSRGGHPLKVEKGGTHSLLRAGLPSRTPQRHVPAGNPARRNDGDIRRVSGPDLSSNQGLAGLIARAESGDASAADALFAALYSELHGLASHQLARSAGWVTLGTTTLLHEAYLNISRRDGLAFPDRAHFMVYAARVMRGLLIDYVRGRKALKRGGEFQIGPLTEEVPAEPDEGEHLARVGAAVDDLAKLDPLLAQVVDLKFFCGFSFAEIAALRGASERTVQRHWEKARMLLRGLIPD